MLYAPRIFNTTGSPDLYTTGVMIVNFVFTLVSVFTSDNLGRKTLLILGSVICGGTLLVAAIVIGIKKSVGDLSALNYIFITAIYVFVASFGVSHGPIEYF